MRIDRERARADYIVMGPGRSLAKLAQRYTEARTENGTLGNLRYWSRTHEWVARAEEHDAQVAGEVSRKAIEAQAEESWDAAQAFMNVAEVGVQRLQACLAQVDVDDGPGAKALADAIIALVRCSGELTGGQQVGAAPGDNMKEAERIEKAQAKIVDLWNERHNRDPNGRAGPRP